MAVKFSIATGNWSTAGTWGTVDATSYSNSESTVTTLTTIYGTSSTFIPGAITISGIAIKLASRSGTTGTITVGLDQAGSDVVGTIVTINMADLPSALASDLNGGWIFFKFPVPVTLLAATSYSVKAKTSSPAQAILYTSAAVNFSRALVTTTTGAPVAGDDVIIAGEYTGSGTSNSFTVTMDITAATDYGAASTSLATPGLAICSKGTLSFGVAAATNYQLKLSGHAIVYTGGTLNIGTVATPIPRNSTALLQFDCAANVDFGLTIRNLGTFTAQGLSRTVSKNIYYCKLNTDEAIASTSLGVDTDTGWLDNDEIAVASTTRTATACESGALNGAAGASTLTVDGFLGAGGGLAAAHSGTSPTQAEIILLTRNVRIFGASATLQTYIDIKATAQVDCDWVEFKWFGSSTGSKRGIECGTTTGSCSIQYCSLRNFEVSASYGFSASGTSGNGFTFSNNVTWRVSHSNFVVAATSATWIADGNIFLNNLTASGNMVVLNDFGGTFTNNTMAGTTSTASIGFLESAVPSSSSLGVFSNITVHSSNAIGVSMAAPFTGEISGLSTWRHTSYGLQVLGGDCTISNLVAFGNLTANISSGAGGGRLTLISPVLNGEAGSGFATTYGIGLAQFTTGAYEFTIVNGDFGTSSGTKTSHTTADIGFQTSAFGQYVRMNLINTKLSTSTEIIGQISMTPNSIITSQKHDQTSGLHKTFKRFGTISIESTTVQSGTKSMKLTPSTNFITDRLESPSFLVAVASGQSITPTVYVYENALYNGARAELILKRNDSIGVSADVILDTATAASDLAWEALTGTTATATDDGVMEFVVACSGTLGDLFVDSFTVA